MSISLSDQTATPVKTFVHDQHLPLQKEPTLSTFWRHTLHCRFFLKVFSLKTWGSPFPPCTHTQNTHTHTHRRENIIHTQLATWYSTRSGSVICGAVYCQKHLFESFFDLHPRLGFGRCKMLSLHTNFHLTGWKQRNWTFPIRVTERSR